MPTQYIAMRYSGQLSVLLLLLTWWKMPPSYGSSPRSYKNKPSCTVHSQRVSMPSLLSLAQTAQSWSRRCPFHVHLLKLLTGVEISALPVKRSGRPGKARASVIRRVTAAENSSVLGWPW